MFERAALTYVGAALTARDRVAQGYEYLRKTYGDTDSVTRSAQEVRASRHHRAQPLRAADQEEPHARRARAAPRRGQVQREVKTFRRDVQKQVKPLQSQVDLVSAQVENAVQTGVTEAQKAVERSSPSTTSPGVATRGVAPGGSAGLIPRRQKQYLSSLDRRGGLGRPDGL